MQPHLNKVVSYMYFYSNQVTKAGYMIRSITHHRHLFMLLLLTSIGMFISNNAVAQVLEYENDGYYSNRHDNENMSTDGEDEEDEYRRRSRYRYRNSENDKEYHRAFREDELMNKRRSSTNSDNSSGFGGIGLGGIDNLLKGEDKNGNDANNAAENNMPKGNYGDVSQVLRPDELQSAGRSTSEDVAYDKLEGATTPDGQTPPPPPPPPDLPVSNPAMLFMLGLCGIFLFIRKRFTVEASV